MQKVETPKYSDGKPLTHGRKYDRTAKNKGFWQDLV